VHASVYMALLVRAAFLIALSSLAYINRIISLLFLP
jgi:hypothetical protein